MLLMIIAAVATRIVAWWNPVADIDPPFYNLVGAELLNGQWPYVDIWDRKPLGLFLLHAGVAWLTGGTILGLNLIATGFAAATAFVIRQISLRFATPVSATYAALAYLIFMALMYGQTAQTPVFYNLFMAMAAWLLFSAADDRPPAEIRLRAFTAMLLCGLSIWIKQVAFVEGAYFGLAFLWLLRRRGDRSSVLLLTAVAMVLVALLPNLVSLAGYALAGQSALDTYVHANFISIFQRTSWGWHSRIAGIGYFALMLFPLAAMAAVGLRQRMKVATDTNTRLLVAWLIAAMLGFLIVPEFFPHYALPALVPLCIAASAFFARPSGALFFLAIVGFGLILGPILDIRSNRVGAAEYSKLNDAVDLARRGGCIYVADGPTHLYSTTGTCRLTRYIFPDHLSIKTEANAVGIDSVAETARILRARPAVIVTQDRNSLRYTPEVHDQLVAALQRDYSQVYRTSTNAPRLIKDVRVWQRNDLAPPHS